MNFGRKIKTIEQAKVFLVVLVHQNRAFNLDYDPKEVIDDATGERVFTDKEAEQLVKRIEEMYAFDWGKYEGPIGYLLHLLVEEDK